MKRQNFSFIGLNVSVETPDDQQDLREALEQDFGAFKSQEADPALLFQVQNGAAPRRWLLPWFSSSLCKTSGWTRLRRCEYPEGLVLDWRRSRKGDRILFWLGDLGPQRLLREVLFTAILSGVSENLELRGLQRIHALGICWKGASGLVSLPSGMGKSTLAVLAAQQGAKIYSDESPFLRSQGGEQMVVLPFPLRLGLRPEVAAVFSTEITQVAEARGSLVRKHFGEKQLWVLNSQYWAQHSSPVNWIGVPSRSVHETARISRASAFVSLFGAVVLGLGLTQMKEFMLLPGNFPRLAKLAVRRMGGLFRLVWGIPVFAFPWSDDARQNYATIKVHFSRSN